MEDFQGPQIFNQYAKERPVTTNQTYGFFLRDLKENEVDTNKKHDMLCKPPEKVKLLTQPKMLNKDNNFLIAKKVDYFVAPPVKQYREECPIVSGTSQVPDNRLTKIKGIQLWHGYTGALVNIKPP